MTCAIDNAAVIPNPGPTLFFESTAEEKSGSKKVRNDSVLPSKRLLAVTSVNIRPEDFIAFQMSCIPEQKGVFVFCDQGGYYITVLVEKRDLALNRRIFEREREIMHFYRQFRFDLSIIPLMNRTFVPKGKQVL